MNVYLAGVIHTTIYNTNATPAYGISVSSPLINLDKLWNTTDPIWPALNMEYNGD